MSSKQISRTASRKLPMARRRLFDRRTARRKSADLQGKFENVRGRSEKRWAIIENTF
jgi:hypothetical protein